MSEIYLIRHAQASFGSDNYDRLSPLGLRQADLLARFLDRHGVRFDAVYSGAMQRQVDTAKPIHSRQNRGLSPKVGSEIVPAFNEYDSLALIKARFRREKVQAKAKDHLLADLRQNVRAFQAFFSDTVNQWMAGVYDDEADIEPWARFCERIKAGLAQVMGRERRGKRLAVVTSGGPIAAVLKIALDLSDRRTATLSWEILNASITCLKYSADRLTLTVFNNTTHFLVTGDASLLTHR
ncbi:MAG: histidine phosphatase family protein [Desulfosarcinaceae bacterium]